MAAPGGGGASGEQANSLVGKGGGHAKINYAIKACTLQFYRYYFIKESHSVAWKNKVRSGKCVSLLPASGANRMKHT